jgi:hypothetical protein
MPDETKNETSSPQITTVSVDTTVDSSKVGDVLVKLHEQAKQELDAAEVLLVEVRHELGRRVEAVFRVVERDVKQTVKDAEKAATEPADKPAGK